jgi:putative transposase
MPRRPRVEFDGALYHVTTRGVGRASIAADDDDRRAFVALLAEAVARTRIECHAWCLMPNHYHLVVGTPQGPIAPAMHRLNMLTARRYNRRHGRTGHLYEARYHAAAITSETHLIASVRYVALNPVRAGLCAAASGWPWSSFRATAGLSARPDFLTTETILEHFAPDEELARREFRAYVEE